MRYYYSPYFDKYSADAHKARFEPLILKFQDAFREESNVWMLLNHILSTMMDFALKVYDGELPNNEETAEHVFRIIYYAVRPYFKRTGTDLGESI